MAELGAFDHLRAARSQPYTQTPFHRSKGSLNIARFGRYIQQLCSSRLVRSAPFCPCPARREWVQLGPAEAQGGHSTASDTHVLLTLPLIQQEAVWCFQILYFGLFVKRFIRWEEARDVARIVVLPSQDRDLVDSSPPLTPLMRQTSFNWDSKSETHSTTARVNVGHNWRADQSMHAQPAQCSCRTCIRHSPLVHLHPALRLVQAVSRQFAQGLKRIMLHLNALNPSSFPRSTS